MAKQTSTPTSAPSPSLYGPGNQAAGRPYVYKFPTPNLSDRIFSVRVDSRSGSFVLPSKGEKYSGPDAEQFEDFLFATAAPIEGNPGWWNLFYLNERFNQDRYNYTIEYPYADTNYPKVTRTYVLLRGTVIEPTADELDPVFNGITNVTGGGPTDPDPPRVNPTMPPGIKLILTDHKLTRFENEPIIDALFVGVTRVYENLPGPVITTYEENPYQQIMTVQAQEVQYGPTPIANAFVDVVKVERTTTAKQKNTIGTVPDVPAKNIFTQLWSSPYRDFLPIAFRYKNPLITVEYDDAGIASAADAALGPVDTTATSAQITEFRRHHSRTSAPITHTVLQEERLSAEQQLITVTQTLDPSVQDISPDLGALLVSGRVEQVGLGATIKTEETVTSVFPKQEESSRIPDILPPEFRAQIPTVVEAQTQAGVVTIGVPPTLGPGELERRNIQETEFKERVEVTKRALPPLPFIFVDFRLLEDLKEGMGGVLTVTRTLAQAPIIIDQGFFVTRSEVKHIGAGLEIKETDTIDAWPVLQEVRTDPETGIIVNITKTMILPLPPPTPGNPGVSNPNDSGGEQWVDVLPIDKWRSIQIVSRVDCSSLPRSLTWATTYRYSFPPQLLTIEPYWDYALKQETQSSNDSDSFGNSGLTAIGAAAYVEVNVSGLITYTATAGFHDDFPGFVTRIYTCGPPNPATIGTIFNFHPVDGSAVISGAGAVRSVSVGPGGGEDTLGINNGSLSPVLGETEETKFLTGERVDLRGMLTGYYTNNMAYHNQVISNSGPYGGSTDADAIDSNNNDYSASVTAIVLPGAQCIVSLPLSIPSSYGLMKNGVLVSPSQYKPGTPILVAVDTKRWRFGIFVTEQIWIMIPTVNI